MTPMLGIMASSISGSKISTSSFESIATYTATGGETSFTFSSIPQTYKSLQIRWMYRDAGNGTVAGTCSLAVNMNGTTDDLPYNQLFGNGTSAVANEYSKTSILTILFMALEFWLTRLLQICMV